MACGRPYYKKVKEEWLPLPCGRCSICRRRRINQWVFRLQVEKRYAENAKFVTLTYNDKNVPRTRNNLKTVSIDDHQKFIKLLRYYNAEKTDSQIKYYMAAEYGEKTKRPHYHYIIYNCDDSVNIMDVWNRGYVHIDEVTRKSIAYTAKYIDKVGKIGVHDRDDRKKEFSKQSKGLGMQYIEHPDYEQWRKWHKKNLGKMYVVNEEGWKIPMPRIYRERLFTEEEMILQRKLAEASSLELDAKQRLKFYAYYHRNKEFKYEQWKMSQTEGLDRLYYGRLNIRELNNLKEKNYGYSC